MALEPRLPTARLVVEFGICTFFPGRGKQTIATSQRHGLKIGHANDVTYRFDGLDSAAVSRIGLTSRNVTKRTVSCQLYHSHHGTVEVEFTFGALPSLLKRRSVSESYIYFLNQNNADALFLLLTFKPPSKLAVFSIRKLEYVFSVRSFIGCIF